ncbi:MFS transporter [Actinomycetospora sp. NBRC 106375]|uniref:MFS transporter n=1 Tax=Actinomycetospora sp. NBRC 106375 TaxID=3032207 RepID=UPI0024A46626|nr:MFS transporter [Actinomycetospora sp. NBRC 106375]GLZ46242.1 MFS transporter [Actinomycetospora sp. NBRC 106375]
MPLYPLYALLFVEHGLSDTAISALFGLWSVTTLAFEVPSGAWADVTSRRRMLALAGLLSGSAFALWVLAPSLPVFAVGFVLWGLGSALASGTLEALAYDALAGWDATERYATLMGRARSGYLAATLVATLAAAPLVQIGGYLLPGLVGAAASLAGGALALTLPEAERPRAHRASSRGALTAWWATLRAGLAEVSRTALLRRAVVVTAVFTGLMALDEYLPLLAADRGASPAVTALVLAGVGVAESACVALAGRVARARGPVLGVLLGLAAIAVAVGALLPLGPGFAVLGAGWGVLQMLLVVVETRVQDAVAGEARATVTSVAGLGSEAVALGVLAVVGAGSPWVSLPVLVAALAVPLLAVAVMVARHEKSPSGSG